MTSGPPKRVLEVARAEAEQLMGAGALATILTGSWARGDAYSESDIDVRAVGDGPDKTLKRHEEFLVSLSAMSLSDNREAFSDPAQVGEIVPGWRTAKILFDPDDVAAALKRQAEAWSWEEIEGAQGWVAARMTELAEEVHTLFGNLEQDEVSGAAAIRSQIALDLAKVLSVQLEILYSSENELWALVGEKMGGEYQAVQQTALGIKDRPFEETCGAAFKLFELAAARTWEVLNDQQREVVGHARELATRKL